ncbi:TetR/AcrR family transcriptional regulator [Shewanella livingstonensis]|uniref:TetR/AcrR family transcriptional regulator n=1 Tax=Shewanella livingstonensis TaxID=150120 RepID=A0A3G8LRV9_9GAMM|nr:TetR/AcrR family transcriptional regulator [Shewanella livingstonensis]AZG72174.1 TetR/AcrR family transcriptional regulator [Shewanella livingstonensis]
MAKRSRVETELTVNQILDEAFKQILTIGFEAMSYTTLSAATGVSRTGISHHFPRKTEFLVRLDQRIGQFFIEGLDFTSIDALQQSWADIMRNPQRKAVLQLFFSLCGSTDQNMKTLNSLNVVKEAAMSHFADAGRRCVEQLIGNSALVLLQDGSVN